MFISSLPGTKGGCHECPVPVIPGAAFAQFFGFFFRLRWWLRRQIGDLEDGGRFNQQG